VELYGWKGVEGRYLVVKPALRGAILRREEDDGFVLRGVARELSGPAPGLSSGVYVSGRAPPVCERWHVPACLQVAC